MKTTQLQRLLLLFLLFGVSCTNEKSKTEIAPPSAEKAIIYHINVRDFSSEGTLLAILPRLVDLKALGVNTLVLSPIHPIGQKNRQGSLGSVFAGIDFKGIHPELGQAADFETLVDSCHALGLYVLLEWDGSLTAADHPWLNTHPDWYLKDSSYYPLSATADLAQLDVTNNLLLNEMSQIMAYWVATFSIDGFFVHSAANYPSSWWTTTIADLKKGRPLLLLTNSNDQKLIQSGFDLHGDPTLHEQLPLIFDKINAFSGRIQTGDSLLTSTFHFICKRDQDGNVMMPSKRLGHRNAAMLAFLMSATMPGVPYLVAGEEVGYTSTLHPHSKNTIIWSANPDINQFYKTVLQLRTFETAFLEADYSIELLSNNELLLIKRGSGSNTLYVLINSSPVLATMQIPDYLQNKRFIDRFNGRSVLLEKELFMLGYSFYLLKEEPAS